VILYRPARDLFHFGPLHADDLAVVLCSGAVILVLLELTKKMLRPLLVSPTREARTVSP
jgi:P-type Ca2+ transporter type 2C